mmetsp:Transcript_40486/g.88519  ORF Transcript_40486/g.88519 Transcript_40486/m.88519 type:complete len:131 (-) Transcript_40486:300-692(-)
MAGASWQASTVSAPGSVRARRWGCRTAPEEPAPEPEPEPLVCPGTRLYPSEPQALQAIQALQLRRAQQRADHMPSGRCRPRLHQFRGLHNERLEAWQASWACIPRPLHLRHKGLSQVEERRTGAGPTAGS